MIAGLHLLDEPPEEETPDPVDVRLGLALPEHTRPEAARDRAARRYRGLSVGGRRCPDGGMGTSTAERARDLARLRDIEARQAAEERWRERRMLLSELLRTR